MSPTAKAIMRMHPRFLPALLLLLSLACGGEPPSAPITALPRALTAAEQQLVSADNRFAFSLLRELARQEGPDRNVIVSPVSMAMALGMATNGAGGATRDSMLRALELTGASLADVNAGYRSLIDLLRGLDGSVAFTIANSVWHRQEIALSASFLNAVFSAFDAHVASLDFASPAASATINGWVSQQTGGRIPEIVPAVLPADAIAYLINAIYFKGAWTRRFDPARTADAPFYLRAGGTVSVPIMTHGVEVPVSVADDGEATVFDLPYARGAWSMTVVLPHAGVPLDSVVARLGPETWNGWIAALDSTDRRVFLPRFTTRYDLAANPVLKALGMRIAFCDEPPYAFDFTPMYPPGGACISAVKHKTFVEVNEEGTEAAAATSVEVGVTSAPAELRVDRPFLFAIRERFSGTILFLGRIMNPTVGD